MTTDLVLYINNIFLKNEDDIKDNTFYNTLLVFSGLTKSCICKDDTLSLEEKACSRICSWLYAGFVQCVLLMGNINIILFKFTLNPYDISVFIYYLFFLGFFIYGS